MRTTERIGLVYRELRIAARRSAARRTRRPFLHLRALKAIQYEGLHTQAELADRLQIDPPAASRLVSKLVADKLIARRAGPNRRCVCLVLLRAGISELAITDAVLDELDATVLSHLTAVEARTLDRLLAKITDGLVADEQAA